MTQTKKMPEFDTPPVSEVALSVEFSSLEKWTSNTAILYGKFLQKEYPNIEIQPTLPSGIEIFGDEILQQKQIKIEALNPDGSRFWYLAEPPVWLIQLQKNRFVLNWRKVIGDEEYPRYIDAMRPRFEQEWGRFTDFINQQEIGNIDVLQCEVTYVNDILKGKGWENLPEGLSLIAPLAGDSVNQFLPPQESFTISGTFLMPKNGGRLRFSAAQLFRTTDKKETIQMRITARGKLQASTSDHVLGWMDYGREWVVRGFTDLTTEKAHSIWGRKQ